MHRSRYSPKSQIAVILQLSPSRRICSGRGSQHLRPHLTPAERRRNTVGAPSIAVRKQARKVSPSGKRSPHRDCDASESKAQVETIARERKLLQRCRAVSLRLPAALAVFAPAESESSPIWPACSITPRVFRTKSSCRNNLQGDVLERARVRDAVQGRRCHEAPLR